MKASDLLKEPAVPHQKPFSQIHTIIVSALGGAAICSLFSLKAPVILLIGGLIGGLIGAYASRKYK